MKLSSKQIRFLALLAADPAPSIFQWMSEKHGRLIQAEGRPENWTHFQIITRVYLGRRQATVTRASLHELVDAGYVESCEITPAGRRALAGAQP